MLMFGTAAPTGNQAAIGENKHQRSACSIGRNRPTRIRWPRLLCWKYKRRLWQKRP